MTSYQKYQLQWMLAHGYSLEDLIDELSSLQAENLDYRAPVTEIFRDWEKDSGFGGELWVCEEEWSVSADSGWTGDQLRDYCRRAMCEECDSEHCIFNPEGVCLFPMLYGKAPMLTEEDGCLSSVYDEGIAALKKQDAQGAPAWKVVIVSPGGDRRDHMSGFATEAEAEAFADSEEWQYTDENGFVWDLEVVQDYSGVLPASGRKEVTG